MRRASCFAALALFSCAAVAAAQEVKLPGNGTQPGKLLLDNERVRVSEILVKRGAKLNLPGRTNHFAYVLDGGTLLFSPPGKKPFQLTLEKGDVSLLPAEAAVAENDGEKDLRALIVEIKETRAAATAPAAKSKGKAKGKAKAKTSGKASGKTAKKKGKR